MSAISRIICDYFASIYIYIYIIYLLLIALIGFIISLTVIYLVVDN